MNKTGILFPHQLFDHNPLVPKCDTIYLIEEGLFFKHYNFHKQKIAFHRASMKFYESYLQSKNIKVVYIDSFNALADVRLLIQREFDVRNIRKVFENTGRFYIFKSLTIKYITNKSPYV